MVFCELLNVYSLQMVCLRLACLNEQVGVFLLKGRVR